MWVFICVCLQIGTFSAVLANNRWRLHVVPVSCLPVPHAGLCRECCYAFKVTFKKMFFFHFFYRNDGTEMATSSQSITANLKTKVVQHTTASVCFISYVFIYLFIYRELILFAHDWLEKLSQKADLTITHFLSNFCFITEAKMTNNI